MPAVETPLTIEQGADFARGWLVRFNGAAIDDTWTARSQIRPRPGSDQLLHEFAASVNPDGSVVIAADATESAAWAFANGHYDVKVTSSDGQTVLRVAMGPVFVRLQVTR